MSWQSTITESALAPFYKWLHRAVRDLPLLGSAIRAKVHALLAIDGPDRKADLMESISGLLADDLRRQGLSDSSSDFLRLKIDWQKEMFRKYPAVMSGARPLTDEGEAAQMTSFETYARGELETYSNRTLELLHADLRLKLEQGVNMSEEVYEFLVRENGYPSLAEAERRLAERRKNVRST